MSFVFIRIPHHEKQDKSHDDGNIERGNSEVVRVFPGYLLDKRQGKCHKRSDQDGKDGSGKAVEPAQESHERQREEGKEHILRRESPTNVGPAPALESFVQRIIE